MKDWFNNLETRERRILIAGGLGLAIILIYFMGWDPLKQKVDNLEQQVAAQRGTLQWMEQAAQEVRLLSAQGQRPSLPSGGQSLLALVDTTAKNAGLSGAVKRLQPEGDNSVRVWMEQASFDALVLWLGKLANNYGIEASSLNIERQATAGQVNARLTLEVGE